LPDRPSGLAEHELLRVCASSQVTPERTARVIEAIAAGPDWRLFRARAWNHGVLPLVHRQLTAAARAGATVPAPVLDAIAASAAAIAAGNLRLASSLIDVCGALEKAGIPTIAYKGPTLALRAYGDLALRHYSDLDILVRRADISSATRVIGALGFRTRERDGGPAERAAERWGHHRSFARDGTLVEVHWRFNKRLFGETLPAEQVWARTEALELAGTPIRTLSETDELLVLATHASWHGWSQLSWVCDVGELLARDAGIDPTGLLESARSHGCRRPVLLAFHLARTLLGSALPPAVIAAIRDEPPVTYAAALVVAEMIADGAPGYASARVQLALRERRRDKAAFVLRALFQPTPADVLAVRLPPALFPLYYGLRPLRMALKYRPRLGRAS
jgi:hypothetical protein